MIVHTTGIPIESHLEAFEFQLPLETIHDSCDDQWIEWITPLVGMNPKQIQAKIADRLNNSLPEFQKLASKICLYEPFAVLLYGGLPHIWVSRDDQRYPDSVYIPPPAKIDHLSDCLTDFTDLAKKQIRNFVNIFGGIGQRYPWEAVEFDRCGTPCDDGSIRLLHGDDSTEWAVATSGRIKHFDHCNEWRDKEHVDIESFLWKFTSYADIDLFEFAYSYPPDNKGLRAEHSFGRV